MDKYFVVFAGRGFHKEQGFYKPSGPFKYSAFLEMSLKDLLDAEGYVILKCQEWMRDNKSRGFQYPNNEVMEIISISKL